MFLTCEFDCLNALHNWVNLFQNFFVESPAFRVVDFELLIKPFSAPLRDVSEYRVDM